MIDFHRKGDEVLVRATVVENWGDVLKVRVEDARGSVTFCAPLVRVSDPPGIVMRASD